MLDQIIATKKLEVAEAKARKSIDQLVSRINERDVPSFEDALNAPGLNIIAEIKFKSPSHGPFLCQKAPEVIGLTYVESGAAAISVLSDETYFGGRLDYLRRVFQAQHLAYNSDNEDSDSESWDFLPVPLLRKDFIIDPYQVAEACGADASAFLLIVACLDQGQIEELIEYGDELGLDALVEVHDPHELETAVEAGSRIIGVNNRNLKTFEVDIETSFDIARRLEGEQGFTLVAESGISEHSQLLELRDAGFNAFLIGTTFMDTEDPGRALAQLIEER
ncbi:MAG: indole-3-glycerol phosphate synthase TrpC [Acidobacteriota bacterium]|nr:MAG: indole-3-glycerol phosphate synthase TrpC [Acidobacteriota bacterium]